MSNYNKHIILFIAVLLAIFPSYAQGKMAFLKSQKKQKLSFEFINNVIIIPVTLNGKKLSFILDTGARSTILFGDAISDSLQLNNQVMTKIRGLGRGNTVDAIVSKNNRIKINDIYGYNQKIYVILDDSFDLSLKMGKPIHGIIGNELLKNFVTAINYRTKKIIFYNPNSFAPPKSDKYQKFDLEFYQDKPYISAQSSLTDSVSFQTKLLIDTGCSDALWLFEDHKKGIEAKGQYFLDYLGQGLNGSIEGKRSKIKSFQLGKFTFNNITTAFLDSVSTSYAKAFESRDGSLGSRVLERFHIILDYPNEELYLRKSKSFNEEFRYNRAGIGVAYHKDAKILVQKEQAEVIVVTERENNRYNSLFEISYRYELKSLYRVYYIRPNSPAEKAGLKANDLVLKINGKPAYNFNLSEITNFFFGDKGDLVKITVERNGAPFYYEFKLEEPLQVF